MDDGVFLVVVNAEQQYSIWPDQLPIPGGWSDAGFHGPKAACLAHVREVWTDMRPLSLRQRMERAEPADGRKVE